MDNRPASWFRFSLRTLLVATTSFAIALGWVMNERQRTAIAFGTLAKLNGKACVGTGADLAAQFAIRRQIDERRPALAKWLFGSVWLKDIEQVYFDGPSEFADDDMEILTAFPNLQTLDLRDTRVSGIGFDHLRKLPRLRTIYLSETPLTDDGLKHLQGFPELESLSLDETQITDVGLSHLRDLPKLKRLFLTRTQITDDGLVHLHQFPQLDWIVVYESKVTAAGREALQRKFPKAQID